MPGGKAPKAKGSAFERAVAAFLAPLFAGAHRRPLSGNDGKGDIGEIPNAVLELKATKSFDIAGALTQAEEAAERKGVHYAVAVFKRPRRGDPGDSYVIMTLRQWAELYAKVYGTNK